MSRKGMLLAKTGQLPKREESKLPKIPRSQLAFGKRKKTRRERKQK